MLFFPIISICLVIMTENTNNLNQNMMRNCHIIKNKKIERASLSQAPKNYNVDRFRTMKRTKFFQVFQKSFLLTSSDLIGPQKLLI